MEGKKRESSRGFRSLKNRKGRGRGRRKRRVQQLNTKAREQGLRGSREKERMGVGVARGKPRGRTEGMKGSSEKNKKISLSSEKKKNHRDTKKGFTPKKARGGGAVHGRC